MPVILGGNTGIYLASLTPPAPAFSFLLDTYSGASAAYSLRKLSSTYSGNCIRVRRSSDNTEQNIGFVNNVLDTASLLSFVGAGNGFVTTWYDQSGGGNNIFTASAVEQPAIVAGGILVTENGKPSVYFDGSNDMLQIQGIIGINNSSIFGAFRTITQTAEDVPFGYGQTQQTGKVRAIYTAGVLGFATWGGEFVSSLSSISTTLYLYSAIQNGTSVTIDKNASTQSGTINAPSTSVNLYYCMGSLNGGLQGNYYTHMYASEFIFYPSEQSTNKTGIKSNINTYYSIY